jgi:aminoglycoside 6'-N-acetyltransferase
MTAADLPLVGAWRRRPHVLEWWSAPPDDLAAATIGDSDINAWIAELDGRPIAYIQDYRIHDWPGHHFAFLPEGSRGMDILIGEADLLGQGHGAAIVRRHVEAWFARGVPAVGIDPHPDNTAARRAYAKAGFVEVGGPVDTPWGFSLLMARRAGPA